ncbi:Polyamine aminopropyltransferase [Sodalis praecaptivus]
MKNTLLVMLLLGLLGISSAAQALTENEAEDMADLTAVFVYLKNNCGYADMPNEQIRRAILIFAQQNRWDLSNYAAYDMRALGEDSYRDLSGIPVPSAKNANRWRLTLSVYSPTPNNTLSKSLCTKFNRATAGRVSYHIALFFHGGLAKEQPDMSNQETWHETLHDHFGQYFTVDNVLYRETTGQQDLVIFENAALGRVMALDGVVQTTERDEFIYHEMMAHVPLIAHGNAKKVLIIGGGDGGMLREVSRHPGVEQITMVEIDAGVVTFCQKYLPSHNAGAFDDPRFTLVIADGVDFVSQSSEKFDVIISDCTDPIGPGESLFTSDFYQGCARCLNQDGIFVAQNGVCFYSRRKRSIATGNFVTILATSVFIRRRCRPITAVL